MLRGSLLPLIDFISLIIDFISRASVSNSSSFVTISTFFDFKICAYLFIASAILNSVKSLFSKNLVSGFNPPLSTNCEYTNAEPFASRILSAISDNFGEVCLLNKLFGISSMGLSIYSLGGAKLLNILDFT